MTAQTAAQEFATAWEALPAAFRAKHLRPQERDESQVAAWLNELHKATESAVVAGLALAIEHVMAKEESAATVVLEDVRPFRKVMRLLDALSRTMTA